MTNLKSWTEARVANWEKFNSLTGLSRHEGTDEALDNPGEWTLHYLNHRDSDLLDQSNAEVLRTRLNAVPGGDVRYLQLFYPGNRGSTTFTNAALVRVLKDGKPTRHAQVLYQAEENLKDYPLLDRKHYSFLQESHDQS